MLIVHHLENSRSQRILWLLEELGVDYEIKRYGRDKVTSLAPPELKEIHPLGKAPVIVDDDVTVAESGAIIEYLVQTYDDGRLHPNTGTPEWREYTYWMHYAEGTFMPFMIISLILARIETSPMPFFVKPIAKGIAGKVRASYLDANVKSNLDFMEDTLSHSKWFCGDRFTAADVQMSFALEAAEVRTDLDSAYPHLAGFLKTVRAKPAYKAALDRGGHYELMGAGTKS
ncbi:MAG: glutathione S-transferase [Gammaproteobacteria bacterium]|nr:glutathione S-transferase [Gammaproteobacteria bacterium]MBU2676251.1 glutathione S-transferase [Gammaproteobacteria bacterium]NNC56641.1 glutathione S-transferase [Woeseiaceae bacterium]NNL49986.1 glutathione S-transferase [Woeseiaceae bacterium]